MTLLNLTAMSHDVVVRKEKNAPSGPPINRLEGGEKMGGRTDGRFRQVFCLVVTEPVRYRTPTYSMYSLVFMDTKNIASNARQHAFREKLFSN